MCTVFNVNFIYTPYLVVRCVGPNGMFDRLRFQINGQTDRQTDGQIISFIYKFGTKIYQLIVLNYL